MTAIVGVLCNDGVVIGADSSTTFVAGQMHTIEQATEKIHIVSDDVILAGTGYVGHGQRFAQIVKDAVKNGKFKGDSLTAAKHLTKTGIEDLASTHAQLGRYGALVAYCAHQKPCLCEFQVSDFQPELKSSDLWYVSMGSSQPITDPFLAFIRNVYWCGGMPNVYDAVFAITWTLDHAIEINPGGVNGPVRIAVLEADGAKYKARMVEDDELAEHRQNIEAAKDALRQHRAKQTEPAEGVDLPAPPA
jgi:20S proteasome alpha/beta subunit